MSEFIMNPLLYPQYGMSGKRDLKGIPIIPLPDGAPIPKPTPDTDARVGTSDVRIATNFHVFKFLPGNRLMGTREFLKRVERIKNGLNKYGKQVNPIQVNPDFEVVDGNTRLVALYYLHLLSGRKDWFPRYVIVPFPDVDGVKELNRYYTKWCGTAEASSDMQFGKDRSTVFLECVERYGLGENETRFILHGKNPRKDEQGEYLICPKEEYEPIFDALLEMHSKAPKVTFNRTFHRAMTIALRTEGFDYPTFLKKLEYQPTALKPAVSTEAHLEQIQDVYNYRARQEKKLMLMRPR